MNGLDSLLVLIGVVALYLWLGGGIVLALLAGHLRRTDLLATVVGVLAVGSIAAFALPLPPAVRMPAVGGVMLALEAIFYRLKMRPGLDWKGFKFGREAARQTTLHLILLSGSFIFLVPFAWLVVTSLKEESEMSRFPPVWVPTQQVEVAIGGKEYKVATTHYGGRDVRVAVINEQVDGQVNGQRQVQVLAPAALAGRRFQCSKDELKAVRHVAPVWANYPKSLQFLPQETHYGLVFLGNTLSVTLLSILGTLLSSAMVAYSFARLRWPGRDQMFLVLLSTMMLPSAVTMMPTFLIFRSLGWIDSLRALWVPSWFGVAFNIFLLRQFFLGIPNELEDAAKLDGCSYYATFWRIMLPQMKPALAAITIMSFMGAWNNFMGPLIYISSPEKETLAYALQLYQSAHGSEPALLMAASTLVMLPVLLLFFFTQRYFIQGITLTGIKG
jgi:multiple sugar transport system permease protein